MIYNEPPHSARSVISRMTVKTCGLVEVPTAMVREGTDQRDKFDIHRAPTISEDGFQPNSPARPSALLLEGAQHHCVTPGMRVNARYIHSARDTV